ncbi:MAG: outer membrane beta-barrel protein [Candidatus Cloacimonetes bacterium]|nr:outer membrane beta-barrel protein [Candidatus Cloacimonadota bacterium]
MRIRTLLVGFFLMASTTSALAAGPYIGAAGGLSIIHDSDMSEPGISGTAEFDTGYGFNVNAGYNFDPVRVEFEFGYKNADVDKFKAYGISVDGSDSDLTVMSYMANAYYDFKTKSAFSPYIGVGLGLLNGEFKSPGYKQDDTVFGYQFIAGAAYNVDKHLALDLSYRFQGAASDFSIDGTDVSYMSSNIMAGLRYNF